MVTMNERLRPVHMEVNWQEREEVDSYLLVPEEKKIDVISELKELTKVSLGYEPGEQECYLAFSKEFSFSK